MQTTPLVATQQALYKHFEAEAPPLDANESSFTLMFDFPADSLLESRSYETQVFWNKDTDLLSIFIGVGGAVFAPWPTMDLFMQTLNKRIALLLPELEVGGGKLITCIAHNEQSKKAPAHQAVFGCKDATEKELSERVIPVYNRALQALYYVHPVFRYIANTGEEPNAEEQIRLMLIEYGRKEVCRPLTDLEKEKGPCVYLPPGLYGGAKTLPMQ